MGKFIVVCMAVLGVIFGLPLFFPEMYKTLFHLGSWGVTGVAVVLVLVLWMGFKLQSAK